MDIEARGAEDLERLAKQLKDSGNKDLKKELLRGIRESNKGTIKAIREQARTDLPHRGGLADLVARSRIGTRTRLTATRTGVQIRGVGKVNLASINAGRVRHPVFGNRKVFVEQQVAEGWFDKPVEQDLPQIRESIQDAMKRVAAKIERSV